MALQVILDFDDDEEKALLTNMIDIDKYWQNAKGAKLERVMNRLVIKASDKNPAKISVEEKKTIIRESSFETAAERNNRIRDSLLNRE